MLTRHTFRLGAILPLAAALAAWGCDGPAPTEPASAVLMPAPLSASRAANDGEFPLRARAGAVLLQQDLAPDFGPPLFGQSDFDGRCSAPSDFLIRFGLEGQATYLGEFTGTVEHCTRVDWQTGASTTSDGILRFTAANGDEVWGTYAGVPAPGGGTDEMMVFSGGTGRFASASGEGIGHAECDRQAGTCVFRLDGWISYDAADRR